jgi:hypothetical protein
MVLEQKSIVQVWENSIQKVSMVNAEDTGHGFFYQVLVERWTF